MGVFGIGGRGKDDGEEKGKLKLDPAQAAKALPLLVALLALLGIWCLASGALRIRDDARHAGLQVARDDAVMAARRTLNDERGRLAQRLGADRVKAALATGDSAATLRLLRQGWPELQRAELWPADLTAAYAGLPRTGFGALATCEAALAEGKPVARVVKSAGVQRLALAAPVVGGSGPMVAYVELPLEKLASGVEAPTVPSDTYLALRQGSRNVLERGDTSLGNSAEALAIKVPDSDLRIAASTPDATATPFELGGMPAVGLGAILVLLSAWLWVIVRPRLLGLRGNDGADAEPTLADLQRDQPAPEPAVREKVAEDSKTDAVPVAIDRGIFRAYDIRGVMGQTLDASVAELIGQAVGSLMFDQGLDEIVVGRDGRLSGPELGRGPDRGPAQGRSQRDRHGHGADAGGVLRLLPPAHRLLRVGHRQPQPARLQRLQDRGRRAKPCPGAILDLHARIAEDRLLEGRPARCSERDIGEDYVHRIADDIQVGQRLKVVVDAGNGVAGAMGRACWRRSAPTSPRCICDIDGTFPNHHPDPSEPHNLEDWCRWSSASMPTSAWPSTATATAWAWSPRTGKYIFPDRLLMLFAADVLERNPGAHHHLRREVHRRVPVAIDPAPRRQPADVEDRAFADQGQDARDRRPSWPAR
jgi:phosphomannomutase/phosphoglucomutase